MKRKLLGIILIAIVFCVAPKVNAARYACTKSYYSQLKSKAYQVTINYEFHNPENEHYYFTLALSNLQPGVVAEFGGTLIKYSEDMDIYQLTFALEGGKTYEVKLYADEGYPCVGELLYTKKITLPKYNVYSERDECIEYEDFPLCNKWYQKDINSLAEFTEALNLYKESLKEPEPVDLDTDNRNIFEKAADFYKDHIIITGPLTAVAIAAAGYYGFIKYKNKKKRAKIDL